MEMFVMKIRKICADAYDQVFAPYSLVCITVVSLVVRMMLFPIQSGDYRDFLHPWFEELKIYGGWEAIGRPVGNYMVSYIYILAALTHIPLPDIVSIKLVSFFGDAALAWACKRFAYAITKDDRISKAVYCMILFLPTVILNSGAWGQCDSIYTAAMIACLVNLQEEHPNRALIAFAIAFLFKLQSVFLAPVLFAALLQKKVKLLHFFWIPFIYTMIILPALFAGRPLKELYFLYVNQAGTYQALSMNAPNLYAWLPDGFENKILAVLGIVCAGAAVCRLAWYMKKHAVPLKDTMLLRAAFLSLMWIPFLLPHMHERYFYPADILAVLLFACSKTEQPTMLAVPFCSLLLTVRFVFGATWISPAVLSIAILYVCITSTRNFCRICFAGNGSKRDLRP